MRIMGIDYGDNRIGIAVSDQFGWTAQGLDTVTFENSLRKPLDKIVQFIFEYDVEKIIIGLHLNMNGTEGFRSKKTREFGEKLENRLKIENSIREKKGDISPKNIEIKFWDERLTTVSASNTMNEMGTKKSKKKKLIDKIAAVLILQNYLDSL